MANSIPIADQLILWARAGGRCSMPGCRSGEMIRKTRGATGDVTVHFGEMCHIVGEQPTAPRASDEMPGSERNRYDNLILLCSHHHTTIDKSPRDYSVARLKRIKAEHEARIQQQRAEFKPNNLPFPPDKFFRGRRSLLDSLRQTLSSSRNAIISQSAVVHGEGGIGKTRLAIEYAWAYEADYRALLWVSAEARQTLLLGLANLSGHLRLELPSGSTEPERVDAVLRWLRENDSWLLICDNADADTAMRAVTTELPAASAGHVLVTSRRAFWPRHVEALEVPPLAEAAATDFLLARSFRPLSERRAARSVAYLLGYFPLALEQAAAWVAVRKRPWREYLGNLRRNPMSLMRQAGASSVDYKKTVATTWQLNFDELSRDAKRLLEILACFAPEPIPRRIVDVLIQDRQSGIGRRKSDDSLILELATYSILHVSNEYVQIHRLVQLVVREQSVSTATDRLAWCVRALTSSLPSKPEDPVNWRAFEAVLAHVDQLAALSTVKNPTGQQYRELLHACCSFLIASGSHLEAAARLERLVKTSSSDEPVFKARLYNELGGAYWSEARALMPKNKDAAKRSRTAQKRCDRLLRKAEKANRSALELTRENYPNDHSALARQFSNVGNAARDLKKYAEAKALFEDAICHEERASGLRSAQMAVRLNNLALCFLEERKWRRAAKLLEQAAEITAEAAGAESEPMVVRLFNLWQVYNKSRRRVLARRYLSNCVSLAQKILPRGHPKRVRAEAALAKLPRPLLKVLPARA